MWRVIAVICIIIFGCVGCKREPKKSNQFKMAECRNMSMAGKQNPDKDCKRCCKSAGATSHAWKTEVGCTCF